MHLGTTLLNGKTFRPRAVRDGDHAEKLAANAAMPGLVEIDTEHRQDAGEVDSHVMDARWDQSLYCHASHGMNFCRVCCLNSP
jgi:hypothetical protein